MWAMSGSDLGQISPNIWTAPSKMARYWIQILNWTRFRVQKNLLTSYFCDLISNHFSEIFFKHAGILDSNLKLVGFRIQSWAYRAL